MLRYTGYGVFFAGVYLIYQTKPLESLDIKYWARPRAEKELKWQHKSCTVLLAVLMMEGSMEPSGLLHCSPSMLAF
eukprot:1158139-Pelagomonas_calceolata.AAC.3